MKNVLLLVLVCLVGFFISRNWFSQEEKPQQTPAVAQSSPQAAPLGITATKPSAQTPSTDAQKAELLGESFPIRAAVDKLAKQWEQRRHDVTRNEQTMRQTGEREFGVIVRLVQTAGLYAEGALEDVVRAALKHERPAASQAQREILLNGIFATMRVNDPEA